MGTTILQSDSALKLAFHDRMRAVVMPELKTKYGDAIAFYLAILDVGVEHDWREALNTVLLEYGTPKIDGSEGGTRENVERKLRFSLRTGLNSSEAKYHRHRILPGDFPYEGAGCHRGFWGGVSGLQEEQDWWIFRRCVDMLVELREDDVQGLLDLSDRRKNPDRTIRQKYLFDHSSTNPPTRDLLGR